VSVRKAILVINATRPEAVTAAASLATLLGKSSFELFTSSSVKISGVETLKTEEIPLLGVNLGHVGFMAEVEKLSLESVAASVISKSYTTDSRMVLAYSVERRGEQISTGWSLNEVTIERTESTMVELLVQVDRRPLSRWGCDGLIAATPTGSTAYAFSAGGPVLWPNLDAVVLLPISAHALFARPMVISHQSEIVVEIESTAAMLSADALREFALIKGDRVTITGDKSVVLLAHVQPTLFTDRLVAKFKLPVEGWRGE
jgi:NAD+ kinase